MQNKYFKPAQFWTTLASVVAGGVIVGVIVYGMNPLDNVKKITIKTTSVKTDENNN